MSYAVAGSMSKSDEIFTGTEMTVAAEGGRRASLKPVAGGGFSGPYQRGGPITLDRADAKVLLAC